jgi:cytochrome c
MKSNVLLVASVAALTLVTRGHAAEASGEEVFRAKCAACHSLTPGMSTVAPDLRGIVGRKAASLPGFNYSGALKAADFVWTPEKLAEWIASPHNVVAETEMSFPGLPDAKERAAVVEFLKNLTTK